MVDSVNRARASKSALACGRSGRRRYTPPDFTDYGTIVDLTGLEDNLSDDGLAGTEGAGFRVPRPPSELRPSN